MAEAPYAVVTGGPPRPGLIGGMRFFFHIADKYGVSTDGIGCEYAGQDAAVLHASRLAAELAKRGSVVLVARTTEFLSCSASEDEALLPKP